MPRPKKDAALAKSSAGSLEGMLESVPTADFVRIRDSVRAARRATNSRADSRWCKA